MVILQHIKPITLSFLLVILCSVISLCVSGSAFQRKVPGDLNKSSLSLQLQRKLNVQTELFQKGASKPVREGLPVYNDTSGYPVVLIPGDGGNQLDAVLNKTEVVHFYCKKESKKFTLWLDVEELLPYAIDCFTDNIRLVYDNKTRKVYDSPGVTITVPGFGDTQTVEWLDPDQLPFAQYYVELVRALVARGYERGVSVRGAPFDFRKAPNTEDEYFKSLKNLVEETYKINKNRKVVLVTHSLGGMFGLYFLNQQTQAWKDKFIQAFTPISGPFAGAVKILRLFASGDNLDEIVINPLSVRPAQRTYPSSAFLLPSDVYWKEDEVLIYTPFTNYTVKDYYRFFTDLEFPDGIELFKDTRNLCRNLTAPGVPVFHIHGIDLPTPAQLFYDDVHSFPNDQPIIKSGQGDGTVNMRSFKAILKWQKEQRHPVKEFEVSGMAGEHLNILYNSDVHDYILKNILFPKER